jgi:hypothetical protein
MLTCIRYLRALAAFYIRLTFPSLEVYEILEPLMKDYRKLRIRHVGRSFPPRNREEYEVADRV